MENTKIFFDTDVLLNWLCKEEDPMTGEKLWKASHEILKMVENGNLSGSTSLINLMEIVFVLRRKKKWSEDEIGTAIGEIQEISNLETIIPDESDVIAGFNLQTLYRLDPFDALYFAIIKGTESCIISRDKVFIEIVNKAEIEKTAYTPEEFLEKVKQRANLCKS